MLVAGAGLDDVDPAVPVVRVDVEDLDAVGGRGAHGDRAGCCWSTTSRTSARSPRWRSSASAAGTVTAAGSARRGGGGRRRAERPDVVLLDVMMPDVDGPATLERLRPLLGEACR